MPDIKTTTSNLSDVVRTAYSRHVLFQFDQTLVFDQMAQVRWSEDDKDPMPGSSVVFTIFNDMADATTPLTETDDVDSVAISESQVSVSLTEYGNATTSTRKLKVFAYTDVGADSFKLVGRNMGSSIDALARAPAQAGTNVKYVGQTSRSAITASNVLTPAIADEIIAKLQDLNTEPFDDGYFRVVARAAPLYNFKQTTGDATWRTAQVYQDLPKLKGTDIGEWGGARWIQTAKAPMWANAGAGIPAVNVYGVIFFGKQGIGKAMGVEPHVVVSGPFDKLQRFVHIGWYAIVGYGRVRENSLYRVECASSIG